MRLPCVSLLAQSGPVEILVSLARLEPAPVTGHRAVDEGEGLPAFAIVEGVESANDGGIDVSSLRAVEDEAIRRDARRGAARAVVFDVEDGVSQASSSTNYRNGPVAHGDHLCKTARLKH